MGLKTYSQAVYGHISGGEHILQFWYFVQYIHFHYSIPWGKYLVLYINGKLRTCTLKLWNFHVPVIILCAGVQQSLTKIRWFLDVPLLHCEHRIAILAITKSEFGIWPALYDVIFLDISVLLPFTYQIKTPLTISSNNSDTFMMKQGQVSTFMSKQDMKL